MEQKVSINNWLNVMQKFQIHVSFLSYEKSNDSLKYAIKIFSERYILTWSIYRNRTIYSLVTNIIYFIK